MASNIETLLATGKTASEIGTTIVPMMTAKTMASATIISGVIVGLATIAGAVIMSQDRVQRIKIEDYTPRPA